jgi:hypothetical protein
MTTTRVFTLPTGHAALVDSTDWPVVNQYSWAASTGEWGVYVIANTVKPDGRRTMIKLHRLLLDAPRNLLVDHVNHDGLDNRRANLRLCNTSQNGGNSRMSRNNTSGYKGVGWHKQKGKWRAYIGVDRKLRHLGLFDDPWEAAQAYNVAALEAWGEFAFLNIRKVEELASNLGAAEPTTRKSFSQGGVG